MVQTLNEKAHLRDSRFGQPWPRHGLKLLYWMAKECISFDNNNKMVSECVPANRDFGFHHFENRYDENGVKLLPEVKIPYYVVGNLNSPGADELPSYVSKDYSPYNGDDSNTDRIIVSIDDDKYIERVYVTQHIDNSNYDPDATFRISRGLLMITRRMNLEMFQKTVQAASPILISHNVPHTPPTSYSMDLSASLFPEQHINVHNQPLTTPPSSHTPQTLPTSNVAVDLPANLSPEINGNVDKEPPPIAKTNPDTVIPMPEDLKHPPRTCWRNCAIL